MELPNIIVENEPHSVHLQSHTLVRRFFLANLFLCALFPHAHKYFNACIMDRRSQWRWEPVRKYLYCIAYTQIHSRTTNFHEFQIEFSVRLANMCTLDICKCIASALDPLNSTHDFCRRTTRVFYPGYKLKRMKVKTIDLCAIRGNLLVCLSKFTAVYLNSNIFLCTHISVASFKPWLNKLYEHSHFIGIAFGGFGDKIHYRVFSTLMIINCVCFGALIYANTPDNKMRMQFN